MPRSKHLPFALAPWFALGFAALTLGQPTYVDLAYGAHVRQKLDLYLPANAPGPRPLVIFIHGGGWQGGDKATAAGKAPPLLNLGFAFASINYRLSSDAVFPAQSHDCKAAIRWLRAQAATYNLDPGRIGVWGSSAGGHLVALLGTSGGVPFLEGSVGGNLGFSSRVQAVADYFGPTDLLQMGGAHDLCNSPESALLGFCLGELKANIGDPNYAEELALANMAGPVNHVTPEDPPFHIAHGLEDGTVPWQQSQLLFDALQSTGVPATLRLVPGAGHGLPASEDVYVRAFFVERLGTPRKVGDTNCDGVVDFADIDPFVRALAGEGPYLISRWGDCNWYNADANGDGHVDFADINPFVGLLGT